MLIWTYLKSSFIFRIHHKIAFIWKNNGKFDITHSEIKNSRTQSPKYPWICNYLYPPILPCRQYTEKWFSTPLNSRGPSIKLWIEWHPVYILQCLPPNTRVVGKPSRQWLAWAWLICLSPHISRQPSKGSGSTLARNHRAGVEYLPQAQSFKTILRNSPSLGMWNWLYCPRASILPWITEVHWDCSRNCLWAAHKRGRDGLAVQLTPPVLSPETQPQNRWTCNWRKEQSREYKNKNGDKRKISDGNVEVD